MTNGEKMLIAQQRKQGLGYTEIARKLGLSVNTVKSFCRRNGIKASKATVLQDVCRQCGGALQHTPGRKKKQFCSDTCRMRWWHTQGYEQNCQGREMRCLRKGIYDGSCAEVLQPCLLYRRAVRRCPWE